MKHSDESVALHLLARYHKCFPYKVKHSHRLLSSLVEEGSTSVTFQDTCLKEISIPILAIMNMLASGILLLVVALASAEIAPCPGDTRGDRRCNHDPTHRVCAKVRIYYLLNIIVSSDY